MALAGALCLSLNAVAGFTNRSLRAQVAGASYSAFQMTYDLRAPFAWKAWSSASTTATPTP